MLQDVVHPPEHPHLEEISSPIGARIFEFFDPELFSETIQNSEVASSSNCCYEENSYVTYSHDMENKMTPNMTCTDHRIDLPPVFDPREEIDISNSIDFSASPSFAVPPYLLNQNNGFDFSSVQPQIRSAEVIPRYSTNLVAPLIGAPLPAVFEDDCLSSAPSYFPLNPSSPSCSFLGPSMADFVPACSIGSTAAFSSESSSIFGLMCPEFPAQELDYQGDNCGLYCQDSIQQILNSNDLQALSNENQQLMAGNGHSASLISDISSMKDSSYKVGKLSVEARKEKINRYMKKRNERNFSKKIKYACRKTLADSRPRVRGRFAKNDDFGETARAGSSNHDEDDNEAGGAREEEEMVDSSDIFAHTGGTPSNATITSNPGFELSSVFSTLDTILQDPFRPEISM